MGDLIGFCSEITWQTLTQALAGPSERSAGDWLDAHDGWSFWRFNITVQMISQEQAIDYSVSIPGSTSQAPK